MASKGTGLGHLHYEIMRRCYNEKSVAYKDYGAKGIKVCEEWHDRTTFVQWCKDNGFVKGMRINRIDSSKDYSPENCVIGNKNCKDLKSFNQKSKQRIAENKRVKEELQIEKYSESTLYRKHRGMLDRCYNEKDVSYKYYGGRGIDVCFEWRGKEGVKNFIAWAIRNGYKEGLSIDRINNNKGYAPENCRWVTTEEQAINKRRNVIYNWKGEKLILSQISRMENVSYSALYARIKFKGMDIENAIKDIKGGN